MMNFNNVSNIYVSQTNGNDFHTGFNREDTPDCQGPVKSIEAALKRIEEIRRAGGVQPITIEILEDYFVKKPIVIDEKVDHVRFKGNGNTIINGGMKIEGFKEDTFNGKRCFSASIPEIKEGFWFTDFFVDGLRADSTAIPKDGFFIAGTAENTTEVYDAESTWFTAKPEDMEVINKINNIEDCMLSYYHYWVDAHSPIKHYDPKTGRFDMEYRSRFSIGGWNHGSTMRYQLENVADAFENKNEWYLSRDDAKVYYIPANDSQTPESIDAYAPITDKLFIIKGSKDNKVDGITFEGLTFSYTKGDYASREKTNSLDDIPDDEMGYASDLQSVCSAYGAIEFEYAHACTIENCTFKNVSLHAITINNGCDRIRIYGNIFTQVGGGAVKIVGGEYGCDKEDETYGNTISQNRITYCGRRYFASCGILIIHSYENIVSHNDIGNLYYTGISIGWVWGYANNITRDNLVEKNHVYNIGQGKLSDMGAIYMLGMQPGTIIRNNIVHDVKGYKYGGTGIYTDEGSSGILIEKNIVYNIHEGAFNHHYGKMNVHRNNIVAKSGQPFDACMPEMHVSSIAERNIFVMEEGQSYQFGEGYAEKGECGYFHMIQGNNNIHYCVNGAHTLFKSKDKDGKFIEYTVEDAKKLFGLESGSIVTDPKFVDYENNNFDLKDDSPAFALGFERIDTSDVGVTIDL